jgi:anion-transporting  ArsA/GET3 family ATPase
MFVMCDVFCLCSDAFSQKFSKEPTLVNGFDNLYCMEVDNNVDIEQQLAQLQPGGAAAAAAQELGGGMMQELLSSVPGIDEAMSFSELMKQVQAMNYSVVVFDTAPTGHTLRLLSIPRVMETAVSKALSFLVRSSPHNKRRQRASHGPVRLSCIAATKHRTASRACFDRLAAMKTTSSASWRS